MHRLPRARPVNGWRDFFGALLSILLVASSAWAQESPHGRIAMECTDCHTTSGWTTLRSPSKFDHATTGYPLVGEHHQAPCRDCHTTLRFAGTPQACISCHRQDYDRTAMIDHRAAGFSMQCEQCHEISSASWRSSFDHGRTQFATRGAHDAVACIRCHVNNRFRGTPIQCVACHRTEYTNATKPNHVAAGFSTECAMCHRALTWTPAAFYPHPWFPIDAGAMHSPGRWRTCGDCHRAQPTYTTFECIYCHQHEKTRTDAGHSGVSGYVYQSSNCFRCHPGGTRGR